MVAFLGSSGHPSSWSGTSIDSYVAYFGFSKVCMRGLSLTIPPLKGFHIFVLCRMVKSLGPCHVAAKVSERFLTHLVFSMREYERVLQCTPICRKLLITVFHLAAPCKGSLPGQSSFRIKRLHQSKYISFANELIVGKLINNSLTIGGSSTILTRTSYFKSQYSFEATTLSFSRWSIFLSFIPDTSDH